MSNTDIIHQRLHNQRLVSVTFETPGDAVKWLGAVQAQDYFSALWALGLRVQNSTHETIEEAIASRTVVRTWPMRGTLHFVASGDVRWMLHLLTPRIIARSAGRYRQLGLDDSVFAQSRQLVADALHGGNQLTRSELYEALDGGGVSPAGTRGLSILGHLSQEGLLCLGPYRGNQPTFVLLDEWIPATSYVERDEALAKLAERYFTGHGPATVQDFAWWSGLTAGDARRGLEIAAPQLAHEVMDGQTYWSSPSSPPARDAALTVHLLPHYDEYIIAYKDRSAMLGEGYIKPANLRDDVIFAHTIVMNGRIAGTWRRAFQKKQAVITLKPFAPLNDAEVHALTAAAERYGRFFGMPIMAEVDEE